MRLTVVGLTGNIHVGNLCLVLFLLFIHIGMPRVDNSCKSCLCLKVFLSASVPSTHSSNAAHTCTALYLALRKLFAHVCACTCTCA